MLLISPPIRNLTVPRQDAGTSSAIAASNCGLNRNSPSSAGSSFSCTSASQPGWATSPVATTCTPLSCAHFQRCSSVNCLLVARE